MTIRRIVFPERVSLVFRDLSQGTNDKRCADTLFACTALVCSTGLADRRLTANSTPCTAVQRYLW